MKYFLFFFLFACHENITALSGPGSFKVEITALDDFNKPCASENALGTKNCLRPFSNASLPVNVTLKISTLDQNGQPLAFDGNVQLDVQPGRFANVGPRGVGVNLKNGEGTITVQIVEAYGPTRIWVEHCGSTSLQGSFATGISKPLWFDKPRIDELNNSIDNATSPLIPNISNVCTISGDPRFGTDQVTFNNKTSEQWVGYSHGKQINVPPPAIGRYLEIIGCSKEDLQNNHCAQGPLMVTGIGNEGFYVSDINPQSSARGFNHLYAFNFSYPDDLQVGDILLWLRGTPVEFSGTTQLGNPSWQKDPKGLSLELFPKPITIEPSVYQNAINAFGGNKSDVMDLEKLEGALVCMDNLAPASTLKLCDRNESGDVERSGCLLSGNAVLPPLCGQGMGQATMPPFCTGTPQPFCFALSQEEFKTCQLTAFVPANASEYCCERSCYADASCSEQGSYKSYGQFTADVFGNYDSMQAVKIAIITRDANPEFDPIAFGKAQKDQPDVAQRKRLKIVGNLRQVLAARPVWVIVARQASDIEIGGSCPRS